MRGKDQQDGVRAEFVLNSPHQRRQVKSQAGMIETEFLALGSIVGQHRALPASADQELMANAVGVFAPDPGVRDAEDQEIPFGRERNVLLEFSHGKFAAQIAVEG